MTLPRSVAEVLKQHVTLEVEGIDRMYLNVYQPRLQTDRGVAAFFRFNRGATFASSALMDPISKSFIAAVDCFVKQEQIPLITFTKGQRKDDVTQEYRSRFNGTEGIVVVGKRKKRHPSSAPRSAATRKPVRSTPGSCGPRRWSIITTSMASTRTSARSFSRSAPTSPTTPSSASTAMSTSSNNWPRKGYPSRPWTTAF